MRRTPLAVPFPNSFTMQTVGDTFYALDLAGKVERAPVFGAEFTRVFSNGWAIRVFRDDPQDGPRERVNSDLYLMMVVGSTFYISDKRPQPHAEHRRATLPAGLAALHTDVSSGSTPTELPVAFTITAP